jgi:hypothetical protein
MQCFIFKKSVRQWNIKTRKCVNLIDVKYAKTFIMHRPEIFNFIVAVNILYYRFDDLETRILINEDETVMKHDRKSSSNCDYAMQLGSLSF